MPGKALSAAYELQVAAPKSGAEQLRRKCGEAPTKFHLLKKQLGAELVRRAPPA
jgi:hypothetical protein